MTRHFLDVDDLSCDELDDVLATRKPGSAATSTRSPTPREPDSFSVSTSPIRTLTANSSPSRTVTSASVAPARIARPTMSTASCCRSAGFRLEGEAISEIF